MTSPSPFSRLNRGLFLTRAVMVYERLLPAVAPFVILIALVAVAGQWGLFGYLPKWAHLGVLLAGLAVCVYAAVRTVIAFRSPTFTEVNTRLATDNGLRPEVLIGLRHQSEQPKLKIGKAKAGFAAADPFALRFVAVIAAALGFLILGPVPLEQVTQAFCPFGKVHVAALDLPGL